MSEFFKKNKKEVFDDISRLMQKVLPGRINVTAISEDAITIGDVVITVGLKDIPRIGGTVTVNTWNVSYFSTIPATREDPEDVSEHYIGESVSSWGVAQLVANHFFSQMVNEELESMGIERQIAEEKAMRAAGYC